MGGLQVLVRTGVLAFAMLAGSASVAGTGAVWHPPAGAAPAGGLLLVSDEGTREFAIADVERMPMVEVSTRTLTDTVSVTFQGVLLSTFLAEVGAGEADAVTVRAADNYSAVIPRADWTDYPILLATRVEGRPLGPRDRGPARIIYPIDDHPELDVPLYTNRAVWLITEIAW